MSALITTAQNLAPLAWPLAAWAMARLFRRPIEAALLRRQVEVRFFGFMFSVGDGPRPGDPGRPDFPRETLDNHRVTRYDLRGSAGPDRGPASPPAMPPGRSPSRPTRGAGILQP